MKMSFVLNVSNANSSSRPEEFSPKDIEVIVDNKEQNWFKRAHVGKLLGAVNIRRSAAKLADEDQKTRDSLRAGEGVHIMNPPREDAQDHDIFISLTGTLYVTINSRKDKGKTLKKHILKDIVARGFDARIEEIQGQHQQAIEEKDNQIQALEFTNEEHQQKILRLYEEIDDLIKNRHVARRRYFDNVLRFIKKNSKDTLPYYVIQCQYRQLKKYKRCLKLRYPNMEEAGRCDDPNAIHRWNIFKREVIEKPNYYKNHFSLTEEKRELLEIILDVTILC